MPNPNWEDLADRALLGTDIAPNASFGLGKFGLKQDGSPQSSVTGHVRIPRSRRMAVGVNLKF